MPYDATRDTFSGRGTALSATPARQAAAVVTDDNNDLNPYAKSLYIGVGGTLKIIPVDNADGAPVSMTVVAGFLPIQVRRVFQNGTAATGIVALFG